MAETRRYTLDNQLDMEQILREAQSRWLRPIEICAILQNYQKFRIAPEPPNRPPSGSLFLYDRKVLRYFRKDGHNWRKKKDGKTVNEAHERLKAGSVDVLHCYYAHGEDDANFQRRSYWLLEEAFMHIVLVHYREVKGSKTGVSRLRDTEAASSSHVVSPSSSSVVSNSNYVSSPADSTSFTSGQTSGYEDYDSDLHQASSAYPSDFGFEQIQDEFARVQASSGVPNSYVSISNSTSHYDMHGNPLGSQLNFVSLGQESNGRYTNDAAFEVNSGTERELELGSWEQVLEHCTPGIRTSITSTHHTSVGIMPEQENMIPDNLFPDDHNIVQEVRRSSGKTKWQIASEENSSHVLKWPMDQKFVTDTNGIMSGNFHEQIAHGMDLHSIYQTLGINSEQQNGYPLQNGLQMQFPNSADGYLQKSNNGNISTEDLNWNNSSSVKPPLLESFRTDEVLKKVDSFTRWMSKELGEVDNSHMQSDSGLDWDSVRREALADESYSEAYSLSPSLAKEQLFSISDFSPNWAYQDSETKVLITGTFLKSHDVLQKYKWSCMFGEVEVPVEVLPNNVLRCLAPQHKVGRVPFYITCSNRVACSEVREFEYRMGRTQDFNMADPVTSGSTIDMLLHIRLRNLLSLVSINDPRPSETIGGSIEHVSEEFLEEQLNTWLLHKVSEDGKGPNVLDKEGQGVIHLASALGYDWAIAPLVAAGVSINFRDVNGWTALHWAAFCGREGTVGLLISMDAALDAVTDPTPKFPSGMTPSDLASVNGHRGISGFLAESLLKIQLDRLTVKDTVDGSQQQIVPERSSTEYLNIDVRDASLKDSLEAVRIATLRAAQIQQVFRMQSFQRKQVVEYGDEKFGMSNERALSLVSVRKNRLAGHNDEPVHVAAVRIQNKFRGWKGRKEFLVIRQHIVKIQAHVRGRRVRKQYQPIIWSVGIVEKVILRWRRKGSGLRGFQAEGPKAITAGPTTGQNEDDPYDFLKDGRKQTEQRLEKALARVKSMVQYPEAREQYRRLLTVVTDYQQTKAVSDFLDRSDEVTDEYDDMFDLETLLSDDTLMDMQ
ncbi:hypothetical protein ACHQM5_023578 [Ranunculus cassubicifolius]